MAGPFQFKTLKDIYSESISGTNSAFNPESIDLQNQLKKNSEEKSIGGYTATIEKRYNYIRKNQDNLLNYFKSPEGLEFIAKQEILYKSAQYLAPITANQALAGFVPGIPIVSSIINTITGNYNIHRDFVITNMIGQIGLSSAGLQGKQANFANRVSDFKISSLASLLVPGLKPSTQKVYTAYVDDITGKSTNIATKAIDFIGRNLGFGDAMNSDKDRLVKLYNQLTNNPNQRAKYNLDYEFNQLTRNKSEGVFGFGSFYNERSERHIVSKPVTGDVKNGLSTSGEFTDSVKEYWDANGIGPKKNSNSTIESSLIRVLSNNKPFDIVNNYSKKLEDNSDTAPLIDYYFSGVRGEKLNAMAYGDILSSRVLEVTSSMDDKKDLIRFSIEFGLEDYKSSKHIQFRAFLNDIVDNNSATYASTRYIGRADQVHVYEGFTRTIGLGFTIYSRNPDEQKIVFQKLNTLTSLLTPSYSIKQDNQIRNFSNPPAGSTQKGTVESILGGIPRAPIIKLTIGNYINGQYGFITNLSYNIKNSNLWDIDSELPHVIEVTTFSFTPIHDFVVSQGKANDNKFIYISKPEKAMAKATAKDMPKDTTTSTLRGGTGNLPSNTQVNLDTQMSNIITPFT